MLGYPNIYNKSYFKICIYCWWASSTNLFSTIINVPQILLLYQFSLLILQKLYKLTAHYTSVNSYYARHTPAPTSERGNGATRAGVCAA